MVEMIVVCFNLIHDYNHGINDVDLADQARNEYQWDILMPKRKWWWSIMMWHLQILQADMYLLYNKYIMVYHLKVTYYFEFNRYIYLAWIDPPNYWTKKERTYQYQDRSGDSMKATCNTQPNTTTLSDFIRIAPRFTDKSLCPIYGNIRMYLQDYEPHWPVPSLKKYKLSVASLGNGVRQEDVR